MKYIPGYEKLYSIDTEGNVWVHPKNGKKGKYLKTFTQKNGYMTAQLSRNGDSKTITIHRLVALTYLDNPYGYPVVNHLDSDKLNNKVENLEWCTLSMNTQHAYRSGRMVYTIGDINGMSKLTLEDIVRIRRLLKKGVKQRPIAAMFKVTQSCISRISTGSNWSKA